MRLPLLPVAASLALLPALLAAQEPDPDAMIARIAAPQAGATPGEPGSMTIDQLLDHFGVPGVSVAVTRDFRIHWARGWGVADVETGAPVDTETMFQAASISKPVAAMASLKAAQDGVFSLDDDINDILRTWTLDGGEHTAEQPVTPRSLLSHTSGLGDAFGFPGYEPGAPVPTMVELFEGREPSNVRRLFMERAPYAAYEYSGGGVTLMQQALADARGRPFEDILQDEVLGPLGMTRSSFRQPISAEHDRNAARAHDGEGRSRGPKWHVYPEMAAAGLWTTPSDLARFAIEVQRSVRGESNRVLTRESAREMITPVGVGDFAVGFGLEKLGQGWYFQHGGSNWGFRGQLMAHVRKGYGLAIMTNADRGGEVMAELSRRIQAAYGWDSLTPDVPRGYDPPVEREEVDVDPSVLRTYVGTYRLNDELDLVVTFEDGGLHIEPTGQQKLPLVPSSDVEFFLRGLPILLTFQHADDGTVEAVVVRQGGRDTRAERIR